MMKFNRFFATTLSLSITFCASLNAYDVDILTQYRNNGIQNIAKTLDKKLTQEKYWNHYLQNIDTTFGYIEKYENILICDKSQSILSLYQKENSTYKLKKTYNAFTGKMKGDKHEEGDLKTPVGIYSLTKKISNLDSFYGPMAFVTSYPNLYDKYKDKTGKGIWIHGLPTDKQRDEFTKGCIAINNKSIECLNKDIDINKTVLIINEDGIKQNINKTTLASILTQLYTWRYAWTYNELDKYLNFYDESFERFDGMNKKEFTHYKTRVFSKQERKTIIFTNINVIPYPNEENTFQVTFHEQYKSDSFTFAGDKILIIKLTNNTMHILTEQ